MKRRITNIIIVILTFSIGATFGKLINWGYFELSKDISVVDALTLFVTIGAAIYITKIVEEEVQESRIEKDLFISKICELEANLKIIEDLIEEKNGIFNKINSRFHKCRLVKKSIFESINGNFKKDTSKSIEDFERRTTIILNSLKRLLTDTPINITSSSDITLLNGLVNYSSNRILEINIEINSLLEELFKLKVRLNHL